MRKKIYHLFYNSDTFNFVPLKTLICYDLWVRRDVNSQHEKRFFFNKMIIKHHWMGCKEKE